MMDNRAMLQSQDRGLAKKIEMLSHKVHLSAKVTMIGVPEAGHSIRLLACGDTNTRGWQAAEQLFDVVRSSLETQA